MLLTCGVGVRRPVDGVRRFSSERFSESSVGVRPPESPEWLGTMMRTHRAALGQLTPVSRCLIESQKKEEHEKNRMRGHYLFGDSSELIVLSFRDAPSRLVEDDDGGLNDQRFAMSRTEDEMSLERTRSGGRRRVFVLQWRHRRAECGRCRLAGPCKPTGPG